MSEQTTVLVIDDDPGIREYLETLATRQGYGVHTAVDGESALANLDHTSPDLITLDAVLPGMDGLETYREVLKIRPSQKSIIASGYSESVRVKEALQLGAGAYVKKPYLLEKIGGAIKAELVR